MAVKRYRQSAIGRRRGEVVGIVNHERGTTSRLVTGGNDCAEGGVGGGELTWNESLVAHLSLLATFRRRDLDLLMMLRNRAMVWCRENGVSDIDASRFLAGSVARAFMLRADEANALDALRSDVVAHAVTQSMALHSGMPFRGTMASLRFWLRGGCSLSDVFRAWQAAWWHPGLALARS